MGKYFGTDGYRGEAGKTLTSDSAYKIGKFLGWYYKKEGKKVKVAVGKDTRLSSYMFEYSIVAGLTSSGADVYMLHVTTTPSVSYVMHLDNFDFGVMISASHNPYFDNGIKLVNSKGEKMDEDVIKQIELYLDGKYDIPGLDGDIPFATGDDIGAIIDYAAGRNRYIGYLISLSVYSFKGIKVALDCANGASWMIAKSVFDALGAETKVIGAEPDGLNINKDIGSTHIEALCDFVKREKCDIGFAFDGDADRCIAVDENGEEVNGDKLMYILALDMKASGGLINNTVVTTIMSNMGLFAALEREGIKYEMTQVGDKYVYENMLKTGNVIGGEQSGHIILKKYATTGDGILTAIKVMEAVIKSKHTLSYLAKPVSMYPQVIKNIKVVDKKKVTEDKNVLGLIESISKELGANGRIILRESGTEPVVRVMVECRSKELSEEYAARAVNYITERGLTK